MTTTDGRGALRNPRLTLFLLIVAFAGPALLSWFLFNFTQVGRGGADHSHGQLIVPPRPLPAVELLDIAGNPSGTVLRRKWSLVYLLPATCDSACLGALYQLRQTRLAMGKDAHRVQRAMVVYGEFPPRWPDGVQKEYEGQMLIMGSALDGATPGGSFRLADGDDPLRAGRVYLVDPMGNLMLAYAAGTDPLGIIDDLKRLLRYSRAG